MSLDEEFGTPKKISTAEDTITVVDAQICGAGDPAFNTACDVIAALGELDFARNFICYIADPVLTPKLTETERSAASRAALRLKKFLDEVGPYYE